METKKAAILPVKSIGDALLLMIGANHLKNLGYDVTILHDNIRSLRNWFPKFNFKKYSSDDLKNFDHVFVQNDESKLQKILFLKEALKNKKLSVLYFRYNKSKHGPISNLDITLEENQPIAVSLANSFQKFFKIENNCSQKLDTGIVIPKGLTFKKHLKRIILQPTSGDTKKCWSKKKFIRLAKRLKNLGFHPIISVAPHERANWLFVQNSGIDLPLFHTLSEFASYLYESAYLIGNDSFAIHLASLMKIDHIMIAASKKLIKTWQGGWLKSNIILPPSWVPNLKHFRLREKSFQTFISTRKVLNVFDSTYSK